MLEKISGSTRARVSFLENMGKFRRRAAAIVQAPARIECGSLECFSPGNERPFETVGGRRLARYATGRAPGAPRRRFREDDDGEGQTPGREQSELQGQRRTLAPAHRVEHLARRFRGRGSGAWPPGLQLGGGGARPR